MNATDYIDPSARLTCPRVLFCESSPENSDYSSFEGPNLMLSSPTKNSDRVSFPCSPLYRKVRALRLFDSPSTPNTIIQKSAFERTKMRPKNVFHRTSDSECNDRPVAFELRNKALEKVNVENTANVNPFTPIDKGGGKRSRTAALQENNLDELQKAQSALRRSTANFFSNYVVDEEEEEEACQLQAPKRLALQDTNISRYRKEFVEIELIGAGNFGTVYKCKNRLDGTEYAVKKSKKPVAGSHYDPCSIHRQTALIEVWAHAALGNHENVVRYYSAWANHMLIQFEYCNGGSLQTVLETRYLREPELRTLLTHVAGGLKYIHSNDLCHMDIKSGNIFLSKVPRKFACHDILNDGYEQDGELVIYKIGDLGHVTSVRKEPMEEGDCRYLSKEALNLDFRNLFKADMFSLGMTLLEAGGFGPLPKNGDEWQNLRNGEVPDLDGISRDFNDLIKLLLHPDPAMRPSSSEIFQHPVLCPSEIKSKAQLTHELIMERKKNEELMKHINKMLKKLNEAHAKLKATQNGNTPKNRKDERASTITTDRMLRSSAHRDLRSGRSSKKITTSRTSSQRDQNISSFKNVNCLR